MTGLKKNNNIKTATKSQKIENMRRQAYMKAAGYQVPQDGSWGPYQQRIWDSLTVKPKEYNTTLAGLAENLYDRATGNTTQRINPFERGSVLTYNPDNVDWSKTRASQSPIIEALSGSYLPAAAVASLPLLGSALVAAPVTTTADIGASIAGGALIDGLSKGITGNTIGTNVAKHTPLTPALGEMFNPGYLGLRGLAGLDVGFTALSGKSRNWSKPLVRKYIGESYYNNIRPSGYGNNEAEALPRGQQIKNMLVDILKPKALQDKVSDPNYRPKWLMDRNNPDAFDLFRNDAHRQSMLLEPHKELLPDGTMHSLYIKKPDGKYDVDWEYTRHIKKKYPASSEHTSIIGSLDFPKSMWYHQGSPANGRIVTTDQITGNGGFGSYILNPSKVRPVPPELTKGVEYPPQFYSTGDVKYIDTWDVQPIKDARSYFPKLTSFLTKVENKKIPGLSAGARNLKNIELVDAFGGKPFTQETLLPDQTIWWYKAKEPIETIFTKAMKNPQTIKHL